MSTRRTTRPAPHRLRLVTYNILLGGARREELVTSVLRRADADVIALQEASDEPFVRRLAKTLGMTAEIGPPSDKSGLNVALLSRLPIVRAVNHRHPGVMLRSHLEVELATRAGGTESVVVHVLHLAARFGERASGEARRMRELDAILPRVTETADTPHLITGDFNALAPGDPVAATAFFRRMAELRRARLVVRQANGLVGPRVGHGLDDELEAAWLAAGIDPRLEVGIPKLPSIVGPLTALFPSSRRIDAVLGARIERWSVARLGELGYADCYRRKHPRARGFTCATWLPAARIDYVFASPALAPHLVSCDVIGDRTWPDSEAHVASDHLPVVADFGR